jgi:hypothetical protein
MKNTIIYLSILMLFTYFLVAFSALHIDFRLWTQGLRNFYVLPNLFFCSLVAVGLNINNEIKKL